MIQSHFRQFSLCAPLFMPVLQSTPGEGPALGDDRIIQDDITSGALTFDEIRAAGLKIFATSFNRFDGYGDGPMNSGDTLNPGGRPTLQDNGTFLRVNGLDAQTCMECHSVGSNLTVPFTFAIGGVGGSNSNVIFQPTDIDVSDSLGNGFASFNGRFINAPFVFGTGGIELLGKEMTRELQELKNQAFQFQGVPVPLFTHGVSFGSITYDPQLGEFDVSDVEGIDADLVVRPFGRKGEVATVRGFSIGALQFHHGMQPVEVVGRGIDRDGDGVTDEILVGELSALHIFNTNLERPEIREFTLEARRGFTTFGAIGCAECHMPRLLTQSRTLFYSFPEVETEPFANAFYQSDLHDGPAGFALSAGGGLEIPLFSDMKRHDMGPDLAETFGSPLDSFYITAKLWGVADTAPYLHDGRATTLTDAIVLHGGQGAAARDQFQNLTDVEKIELLAFLRSLRTPEDPAGDL